MSSTLARRLARGATARAAAPAIAYRRAVPADAEAFAQLMSDEAVYSALLQMPYPTAELWRQRLESWGNEQDRLHLVAVADGVVVGSCGVHPVYPTPRRRHCATLGISVALPWQRRGIGTELMRRALDWADRWAGYLRLELNVYADNERAIALYERFGFEVEGTFRAHALRDGEYVDSLAMARLHPQPPQLPRR